MHGYDTKNVLLQGTDQNPQRKKNLATRWLLYLVVVIFSGWYIQNVMQWSLHSNYLHSAASPFSFMFQFPTQKDELMNGLCFPDTLSPPTLFPLTKVFIKIIQFPGLILPLLSNSQWDPWHGSLWWNERCGRSSSDTLAFFVSKVIPNLKYTEVNLNSQAVHSQ